MKNYFSKHLLEFKNRQKYCKPSRKPFFDLAVKYIPEGVSGSIVDIGTGDGSFIEMTDLYKKFNEGVYLLDGNNDTVNNLAKKYTDYNVIQHSLPNTLPFGDKTVRFLHMSHIIEHLEHSSLYETLKEVDRVLNDGGILVVSTPLMWDRFWDDLSHVRPYNPDVLRNYMIRGRDNATGSIISTNYNELAFTYRYRSSELISVTSCYFSVYLLIKTLNYVLLKLGFRRYIKNGYTIALQKA